MIWPNMALTKHGIRANLVSFLRDQTIEIERGEEKREEEEEEEEEKKKRSHDNKGMELTLDMDHMNFVWNSRKVYEFQT